MDTSQSRSRKSKPLWLRKNRNKIANKGISEIYIDDFEEKPPRKPINYRVPERFKRHAQDFATISKQHLAEAVRQYDHTDFGNGKEQWAEAVNNIGQWRNRLEANK